MAFLTLAVSCSNINILHTLIICCGCRPTADVKNNNHNSNNGNNADVDLAQLFKQLDDLMAQKKEQVCDAVG